MYKRALQFLEDKTKSSLPIASLPSPGDSRLKSAVSGVSSARLPKLELPKFTGDLKAWTHFWGLIEAHIHNSNHSKIVKFSYLISLLLGSALAVVQGLSVTAAHYDTAVTILKERFGDPQVLIFRHVEELYNLSHPSPNVTADLWQLYNTLHSHVRSLQMLGVQGSQYGILLTPMVLGKLPMECRLAWANYSLGKEGDLDFLLSSLHEELKRRDRASCYTSLERESTTNRTQPLPPFSLID